MTGSTTSTKKTSLDAEHKITNTKEESKGFVEKVDSSRNVYPMDLMLTSAAEVWSFQAGHGGGEQRFSWAAFGFGSREVAPGKQHKRPHIPHSPPRPLNAFRYSALCGQPPQPVQSCLW